MYASWFLLVDCWAEYYIDFELWRSWLWSFVTVFGLNINEASILIGFMNLFKWWFCSNFTLLFLCFPYFSSFPLWQSRKFRLRYVVERHLNSIYFMLFRCFPLLGLIGEFLAALWFHLTCCLENYLMESIQIILWYSLSFGVA